MIIELNDNLLTGNKTIDAQHRELIERIAALVNACEEGDGKMKGLPCGVHGVSFCRGGKTPAGGILSGICGAQGET